MFTGIVESMGEIEELVKSGSNLDIKVSSGISHAFKIDQSVSHSGVCLTVTKVEDDAHWVTAIEETLAKTNLGKLQVEDKVNLERCMKADGRFDGHIVQGHVDTTTRVKSIVENDGSWVFTFLLPEDALLVEKGSICINGTSLTCFDVTDSSFSVAIIPYTYQHTNFQDLIVDSVVNLEFDILGKYIEKILKKNGA